MDALASRNLGSESRLRMNIEGNVCTKKRKRLNGGIENMLWIKRHGCG